MIRLAVVLALVLAPSGDGVRDVASALKTYMREAPPLRDAAVPAYHARREAVAAGCLDVARDAPRRESVHIPLIRLYSQWAGVSFADAVRPADESLVRALRDVTEPAPVLRRARRAFARRDRDDARIPSLLPVDLCATLRAWQARGWRREPVEWRRVVRLYNRIYERDFAAIGRGARFLRRHGVRAAVAGVFLTGTVRDDSYPYADDPVLAVLEDVTS